MANPWLTSEGRAVLEAAFGPEAVAPAVRAGVRAALGVPEPEPPSPDVAAGDVVDRLAEWHEVELASGEQDLSERLAARFGPEILHDPRVLEAVEWTLHQDRGAHAVARGVVARDLADAFAAPAGDRESQTEAVLAAERDRVRARAGTRVARATRGVLASLPPVRTTPEGWEILGPMGVSGAAA